MYLVIISLASLYKNNDQGSEVKDVAFYLPNYNSHFTKVAHNNKLLCSPTCICRHKNRTVFPQISVASHPTTSPSILFSQRRCEESHM